MASTGQRNRLDIQLVPHLSRDFLVASHDEIAPFQSTAATSRNGYPAQTGRPAHSGMPGFRSRSAGLPHGHDDRTNARGSVTLRPDDCQELTRFARRPHLPPTGSSLIAVVSALRPRACRGPMALGDEADPGSRRRRHPSRDAPVPSTSVLASWGSPQTRARAHGRPGTPRQAAKPWERHGRAGRLRFSSPGRGRTWLPGASLPFL